MSNTKEVTMEPIRPIAIGQVWAPADPRFPEAPHVEVVAIGEPRKHLFPRNRVAVVLDISIRNVATGRTSKAQRSLQRKEGRIRLRAGACGMSLPPESPRVLSKRDGMPSGAVYVGRPTRFGNPFVIGRHGDRAAVVARFEAWLLANPDLLAAAKAELRGKDLVCWCAPEACHADVLLRIANA